MSDKFNLSKSFLDELTQLISKKETEKIKKKIAKIHAADLADILQQLSINSAQFLFDTIEEKRSADIIVEVEDDLRESLLADLSPKEIAEELIDNLESDDAADVIAELPDKKQEAVLSEIENEDQANDIADLLAYPENSAGALMAKELISVNENWSTLQCLKEMRKQSRHIKKVHTIYVVNDKEKLTGSLSLKRLLLADTKSKIKQIIKEGIIAVEATENNESVANIMNKYDLIVLPVIDSNQKLIGRITIDDVIDIVKEEAEKDYQMASGISEDVESSDGIWTLTRARLPWLIIGMIGGILGAKVIGFFDIQENIDLALFIPLIAAMGGNVGVQSAAIVVQGLANNSLNLDSIFDKLFKELGVALINGTICSIIILLTAFGIGYSIELSVTVSISLFAVIIFAALFGAFIPLMLEKYKIDPALATGPFITTINDVLGLFIYFLIGQTIL